ncbi:nucleoside/nucleotide kinase family protein [Aquibacillus rhizosphaerae]|uniref:Phosphoribulokinase/uridine kinase domain-containing protein n=1 Tax=Aquibacillus rhizosphaerae TaxID=3051431 RepID=A0ABT7L6I6_9BACI|nr:hypothetical protein [Aquibacillus sp. LR5S19]MDL4840216.1 hypothetical protein [Aquibacillus sp. LR5S19]
MKSKLPVVFAIAAVSGGGKTTITSNLIKKLQNSKALFFDDYDFDGPDDILEWIDNGGNPNEWNLSRLIEDIKKLLSEPIDYIMLDFPFGYSHSKASEFIDFTIFINTPLDIAMARRIIRDFKKGSAEAILLDLENYMDKGRRGYLAMLRTTKPNADLIVDGLLPISDILSIITQNIMKIKNF